MKPSERVRVVIADDLKLQRKMMKAAFQASDRFLLIGEAETGAELVQVAKREKPDLILTDLNMPVLDGAQALRILSFALPGCVFIVFSGEEDIERLRPVIAAGASDFLRKPLQMNRLLEAVETIYDREAPRKRSTHLAPEEGASVISVIGGQAGSGASTVAVNLAVALGELAGKKVALLDFDFQTAAATNFMGLSGSPGILEFFQEAEGVTSDILGRFMLAKHGVRTLAGAPFPLDAARRDPEILTAILDVLAPDYDYVVLDLEPRMDDATQLLVSRSERVYMVTSNDMSCLRAASRWMTVYRHSRPPADKCRLIYNLVNQYGHIPGKDVAETMGMGISAEIAHDPANAQVSYWQGKPAVLDEEAPLGRSLRTMFQKLDAQGV